MWYLINVIWWKHQEWRLGSAHGSFIREHHRNGGSAAGELSTARSHYPSFMAAQRRTQWHVVNPYFMSKWVNTPSVGRLLPVYLLFHYHPSQSCPLITPLSPVWPPAPASTRQLSQTFILCHLLPSPSSAHAYLNLSSPLVLFQMETFPTSWPCFVTTDTHLLSHVVLISAPPQPLSTVSFSVSPYLTKGICHFL